MRRRENRRKKQVIKIIFFAVIIILLCIFAGNLQSLKGKLREAKAALQRVERMLSGRTEAEEEGEVTEAADYVSSTFSVHLDKPIKRTKKEVAVRLTELSREHTAIQKICEDLSLYPEDMLAALANNPEMADFVLGYREKKTVSGGLTEMEKEQAFPLFLQWDLRWGYEQYGEEDCIGIAGCGPACMSMVLFSLTRDEALTPDKMAELAMRNHYYLEGSGTIWAFMDDIPALYGIYTKEVSLDENAMKAELDRGGVMICSMGPGDFTSAGHFIMIYGYDEEGFKVNDPNCIARSMQSWTYKQIERQIKKIWGYNI